MALPIYLYGESNFKVKDICDDFECESISKNAQLPRRNCTGVEKIERDLVYTGSKAHGRWS